MLVIEQMTSYVFKDKSLILEALTHSSYSNEKGPIDAEGHLLADYERLEFLGDAVIGLIVAEMLMFRFRDASEGKLSRWRSSLVSRKALSDIAIDLKLGDHLLLGRGELRTGGKALDFGRGPGGPGRRFVPRRWVGCRFPLLVSGLHASF